MALCTKRVEVWDMKTCFGFLLACIVFLVILFSNCTVSIFAYTCTHMYAQYFFIHEFIVRLSVSFSMKSAKSSEK